MITLPDTTPMFSAAGPVTLVPPTAGRVLLIDDEDVLLSVVGRALRSAGFQVLSASSAEEGLSRFATLRPDCVVVDVYLPGLDGFEFVQRARAIDPSVPMLMLSGLEGIDHEQRAIDVGAREFLPKAIDVRELERHIRDAIAAAAAHPKLPVFALPTLDLGELERAAIAQALAASKGNRTQAARLLGIHVRTLHRKLRDP